MGSKTQWDFRGVVFGTLIKNDFSAQDMASSGFLSVQAHVLHMQPPWKGAPGICLSPAFQVVSMHTQV